MYHHWRLRPALATQGPRQKMPTPLPEPPSPNWYDLNWIVAAIGGVVGAIASGVGIIWRSSATITAIRKQSENLKETVKALEEHVENRHNENKETHKELVGEIRQLRQTLDSFHRDLTRRIDDYMSRH